MCQELGTTFVATLQAKRPHSCVVDAQLFFLLSKISFSCALSRYQEYNFEESYLPRRGPQVKLRVARGSIVYTAYARYCGNFFTLLRTYQRWVAVINCLGEYHDSYCNNSNKVASFSDNSDLIERTSFLFVTRTAVATGTKNR